MKTKEEIAMRRVDTLTKELQEVKAVKNILAAEAQTLYQENAALRTRLESLEAGVAMLARRIGHQSKDIQRLFARARS